MAEEVVRVFRDQPDKKHLVLVTRRKWGYDIRNAIRALAPDVEAQTVFAEDVLETWPAREAFVLLSIAGNGYDPAALRDWVAYRQPDAEGKKWKAPSRNAGAYNAIRSTRGVLNVDLARELASLNESNLSGQGKRYLLRRLQRLVALLDEVPNTDDVLGVTNYVLDPDRWITSESPAPELARDDIDRLQREAHLLVEADPSTTIDTLVERLRNRIATRQPLGVEGEPDINIVTLWGAKGLTANFVYIVGLCDEALPGPFDEDSTGLTLGEYEMEQRRLLYVSVTRAKRALVISRPQKIKRGDVAQIGLARSRAGSQWWQDLSQCRFFADVPPEHLPDSVPIGSWDGIDLS